MPRGGDDVQPEALQVVERVGGGGQLVLASVAGPRVDVSQGERSAAFGRRQGDVASEALEAVEEDEHPR